MKSTFKACGKLILSGEHAVAQGAPAIAIPSDKHCHTTLEAIDSETPSLTIHLPDTGHSVSLTPLELKALQTILDKRYQAFVSGDLALPICLEPTDLASYTCALFFEAYPLTQSLTLTVTSDLPIGCGMGSSAAMIVSLLRALASTQSHPMELHALAKQAENLQHGYSSGLDIAVSLHEKPLWFQDGQFIPLADCPFAISAINTGAPKSTTGECVAHTKAYFKQHPNLIAQFTQVTEQMRHAMETENFDRFKRAIRDNHRLLCEIGVVPQAVQDQITEIEAQGGAAKTSGAGSVAGDCAGMLLTLDIHQHHTG